MGWGIGWVRGWDGTLSVQDLVRYCCGGVVFEGAVLVGGGWGCVVCLGGAGCWWWVVGWGGRVVRLAVWGRWRR